MEHLFTPGNLEIFTRLFMAMTFGMIIGIERVIAHKTAGMRTFALVSMGAALFVIISEMLVPKFTLYAGFSPTLLISQIVTGVGFLCAGLIFFRDSRLAGVTTATSIWVSAGIGMATGFGLYVIGFMATVLTLFVFVVLWFIEQKIKKLPLVDKDLTQ